MNFDQEETVKTRNGAVINEYISRGVSFYRNMETDSALKPHKTVCKHYLRDQCKMGEDCRFIHEYDISRIDMCKFRDECTNAYCFYNHGQERVNECPCHERGVCVHVHCTDAHSRYQICERYLAGFCPLGSKCEKRHPRMCGPISNVTRQGSKSLAYIGVCGRCNCFHVFNCEARNSHGPPDARKRKMQEGEVWKNFNRDGTVPCTKRHGGAPVLTPRHLFEYDEATFTKYREILRQISESERRDQDRTKHLGELDIDDAN